jgi:hypothetical protein
MLRASFSDDRQNSGGQEGRLVEILHWTAANERRSPVEMRMRSTYARTRTIRTTRRIQATASRRDGRC